MMNSSELQQELQTRFEGLPEELQRAVVNEELGPALREIARPYRLSHDQRADFETETFLVLIGITHVNNYTDRLKDTLGLSTRETEELAEDVDIRIFAPLRGEFIELYALQEEAVERLEKALASMPEDDEIDAEGEEVEASSAPENDAQQSSSSTSVMEQRLQGTMSTPKQSSTVSYNENGQKEERSEAPTDQSKARPGPDPYRESPDDSDN